MLKLHDIGFYDGKSWYEKRKPDHRQLSLKGGIDQALFSEQLVGLLVVGLWIIGAFYHYL